MPLLCFIKQNNIEAIKLVIEGNKGSVLIVSGDSYLLINSNNYKYGILDNKNIFKGTLISVKLNKNEVQNVFGLIEYYSGNPYKYLGD